jgi:predicted nicotinamide N-methyase
VAEGNVLESDFSKRLPRVKFGDTPVLVDVSPKIEAWLLYRPRGFGGGKVEDAALIETRYEGPVRLALLRFGAREFTVVLPADPDRLLNDPDVEYLNRRDDYMPYWAYLWPGAYLLAEAVSAEPGLAGRDTLEIGCGLGLAGLVALGAGARVCFSDYDEMPLRFVARSAAINGFASDRYALERLDWRTPPRREHELILGADVLYERRLVPLVCGVIRAMLSPDGLALIAGPYRVATEDLEVTARRFGLWCQGSPISTRDENGKRIRGTLHRLTHMRDD